MRVIYEIADETGPAIIEAMCNFGGVHAILIPLYEATIPDPENPEQTVPNPTTPRQFCLDVVARFVKEILRAHKEKQKEADKVTALAQAVIDVEAIKQAAIATELAAINQNVVASVE